MKNKFKLCMLAGFLIFYSNISSATHIDQLGINITLDSSDGAGNFTLLYQEYFGTDSTSGFGPFNPSGPTFWDSTFSSSLSISGAPLTGSTNFTADFQGLVDSTGVATLGYGSGQNTTKFVNDTSDAGLYSALVDFSIFGYDSTTSYLISVLANDCCLVSGGTSVSFNGAFSFDPSTVVVSAVPVPAAAWLFGTGLIGLFGVARTRRRKL